MSEVFAAIETVGPIELGDETLDIVSGGTFPEYDPDG